VKQQGLHIWKLTTDSNQDLNLRTELDYFQTHFVGISMKGDWVPPLLRISGKSKRLRDFISWMTSAPVVSDKAKKTLEELIAPYTEILPLIELRGKQFYAVNVLKLVNCLDRKRSDIFFSPNDGRIVRVRKSFFLEDRVPDIPIFKVPEDAGQVFVTRSFVDAVIANGLRGAAFADPGVSPIAAIFQRRSHNVVPGVPE